MRLQRDLALLLIAFTSAALVGFFLGQAGDRDAVIRTAAGLSRLRGEAGVTFASQFPYSE